MPTIELTDEQAEELRDLLTTTMEKIANDYRMFDPSDADDIAAMHRLSVLENILHLLEIA